jgi:hypothetical protein
MNLFDNDAADEVLDDCWFCIDGNLPAGIHDVLGEVYAPCPHCLHGCPTCDGEGLFPADYTCLPCLLIRLAAHGLAPLLCARCHGVLDLIPRPTLPQVNPHAYD